MKCVIREKRKAVTAMITIAAWSLIFFTQGSGKAILLIRLLLIMFLFAAGNSLPRQPLILCATAAIRASRARDTGSFMLDVGRGHLLLRVHAALLARPAPRRPPALLRNRPFRVNTAASTASRRAATARKRFAVGTKTLLLVSTVLSFFFFTNLLLGFGLFDQVLFENPGVAGVCAEDGIGDVADKGDETDAKVEHNVKVHAVLERGREAAIDFGAVLDDEVSEEEVDGVANTRERERLVSSVR